MPKPTIHDSLCIGLEALGAKPVASKNKYTMYQMPDTGRFYFVGKAGALRAGSKPNAAMSVCCPDQFRLRVLAAPRPTPEAIGL